MMENLWYYDTDRRKVVRVTPRDGGFFLEYSITDYTDWAVTTSITSLIVLEINTQRELENYYQICVNANANWFKMKEYVEQNPALYYSVKKG